MKMLAVLATLVPAVALAQPTPDPNNPQPQPPPQPAPPQPTEAPPPAPIQQQPTVIVNQPPAEGHATVVSTTPQTEEVYDYWNAPVFATGAVVFAASYGASVIVAANSDQDQLDRGNDRLYVPVLGPWLALNDRSDCPIENPKCDNETTAKVLLVADGVFQAAGIITMVTGVLSPSHHTRVVRTADTGVKVRPIAMAHGGSGIGVFGRF